MADTAATIVERWRESVPPEVPKEDVLKVVEAYFPGDHEVKAGGSHFLIVKHEALRLADQHGWSANFTGGRVSISHTGGKRVKAYLIRHLLEAIEIKEAYDKANKR